VLRDGRSAPLWMGTIVEEHLESPLSLLTLARAQRGVDAPRDLLAASLNGGRLAARADRLPGWDGQVLLAHDASLF